MCVSPSPYYIDWFEKYYPNVTLNQYVRPFCLKFTNVIQGTNTSGQQWNRLLDAIITIPKHKKTTIDDAIYIKVFSDVTVSCIMISNDCVLNTTYIDTAFPELRRVFE